MVLDIAACAVESARKLQALGCILILIHNVNRSFSASVMETLLNIFSDAPPFILGKLGSILNYMNDRCILTENPLVAL